MDSKGSGGIVVSVCFCHYSFVSLWFNICFADMVMANRWTFLRPRRLIARARSAGSIPCTRLHNIRREKIVLLHRESVGTIASNQDMEVKPSPCFTRRLVNFLKILTLSFSEVLFRLELNWNSWISQAKTTKKIVLRLQCQGCKHVSQHPIKVRMRSILFFLRLRPLSIKYLDHFAKNLSNI